MLSAENRTREVVAEFDQFPWLFILIKFYSTLLNNHFGNFTIAKSLESSMRVLMDIIIKNLLSFV
jgi:hypothetical protein